MSYRSWTCAGSGALAAPVPMLEVEMTYEIAGRGEVAGLGSGMRRLIDERRVAYGGWCMVPSSFAAEIVSAAGVDWICIDQQHGLIDDACMRAMLQAVAIRRIPTLVRVPWNEPASIMRALDAGADGVVVPMVNNRAEAERAARASHYPPAGYRSWGPLRSSMAQHDFAPRVGNAQAVCLVMVETIEGVDNLEEIVQVPGVDGVLVGPNDLCISYTGDTAGAARSDRDVSMLLQIGDACRRHGLVGAISGIEISESKRWADAGFPLVGLTSDAAALGAGIRAAIGTARGGA
jgi:4-hydroxy-2-oxoheptanedioate aldolase